MSVPNKTGDSGSVQTCDLEKIPPAKDFTRYLDRMRPQSGNNVPSASMVKTLLDERLLVPMSDVQSTISVPGPRFLFFPTRTKQPNPAVIPIDETSLVPKLELDQIWISQGGSLFSQAPEDVKPLMEAILHANVNVIDYGEYTVYSGVSGGSSELGPHRIYAYRRKKISNAPFVYIAVTDFLPEGYKIVREPIDSTGNRYAHISKGEETIKWPPAGSPNQYYVPKTALSPFMKAPMPIIGDIVLLQAGHMDTYFQVDSVDPILMTNVNNPNERFELTFDNGLKVSSLSVPQTVALLYPEEVDEAVIHQTKLRPEPSTVMRFVGVPNGCVSYREGYADEDRYNVALINGDIIMYAVYDGHGSAKAVSYLHEHLPDELARALLSVNLDDENEFKSAIKDTFFKMDRELHDRYNSEEQDSGATATIALRYKDKLCIEYIGDSRGIVYDRTTGEILYETVDHDVSNKNEVARVEGLGGKITRNKVAGVVEVTRSFGDFRVKKIPDSEDYYPEGWVSVMPDIDILTIVPNMRLVLASDGLWYDKYEDSATVVKFISTLSGDLCGQITAEAHENARPKRGRNVDDVVVILVDL